MRAPWGGWLTVANGCRESGPGLAGLPALPGRDGTHDAVAGGRRARSQAAGNGCPSPFAPELPRVVGRRSPGKSGATRRTELLGDGGV